VLVLGSGNLVHNLRRLGGSTAPSWATEFDAWCADVLERRDVDALVDYRRRAPAADVAHPTKEHFVPVIVALGAALDGGGVVSFPVRGFEGGSVSRRCVQFA
jgi:4,5-DOPA dioxygenase extradiol